MAANARGHADHTRKFAEQMAINAKYSRNFAKQMAINEENSRNFAEQKAAMDNWYFLQLIQ